MESAFVYFLVENLLHILLMLCCGGGFLFFFFFWLALLAAVALALRGGSSESLEELYPNLLRSRWADGRAGVEDNESSAIFAFNCQVKWQIRNMQSDLYNLLASQPVT